jgi:hypothetical protein
LTHNSYLTRRNTEQELKASYRRLQKEFHPDQSGDQFVDLSAEINDAFSTLKVEFIPAEPEPETRNSGSTQTRLPLDLSSPQSTGFVTHCIECFSVTAAHVNACTMVLSHRTFAGGQSTTGR